MEPSPNDIERYIAQGLDCEVVKVSGDGRHFEALIVSSAFEGQSRIARHQQVYRALGDRMRQEIHALSMRTLTPAEYQKARAVISRCFHSTFVRGSPARATLAGDTRAVRAHLQGARMPDSLPVKFPVSRFTRAVQFRSSVNRPPLFESAGDVGAMDKLKIRGGTRLGGEITVSGAKNAALPILAASLLTADELIVDNVPQLQDVATTLKLLKQMGVAAERDGATVRLKARDLTSVEAPYELVKTMRASILVLGPLVARAGGARVRCPAVARLARAPSINTSRDSKRSARRSVSKTATWSLKRSGCEARAS